MTDAAPVLIEAVRREQEFWDRHGISSEGEKTGQASPAHRAWVKAVEHEYGLMGKDSRVHLDMPISRKAFILGYRMALAQARADAIEAASRALIEYYGHSSGCGQIFEWPFSKEMVDGCNCYTSTRKELSILRALKSPGGDKFELKCPMHGIPGCACG